MKFATATNKFRRAAAFTLAEVLAAMLFMAIVIPVVVQALHVASMAGEVSARKAEAARVADTILNENIVTTNWNQSVLSGTVIDNGHEYRWTLNNQAWAADSAIQLLSAEVTFSAGARQYSVRLNTLASSPSLGGSTTMTGLQ
jgi:hypothetical protein